MALYGQQGLDELQVVGLILYHHDRRHHGCSGRLSARRRVNQKVLPLPSSESTPMVPPCSSTRRLESATPRPVPSYRRLALASSCTNSCNSFPWSAGAIPTRVPLTAARTRPASSRR